MLEASATAKTTLPCSLHEPLARSRIFAGFQAATVKIWGGDAAAHCLKYLSLGALNRSVLVCEEWLPERYALEWFLAVWNGPAAKRYDSYTTWVRCLVRLHAGRLGRNLAWLVGRKRTLASAPASWRRDHTTGQLDVQLVGPSSAVVTLLEHPYVATVPAYVALAEFVRYGLVLARAEDARVTALAADANELKIHLRWRAR